MKTLTWQHVIIVALLLGAVVATNIVAPGGLSAVASIIATLIAYVMKPQLGGDS